MSTGQPPGTTDRLERIVAGIYAAALEPSRWAPVLREITEATRARGAMFAIAQPATWRFETVVTDRLDTDLLPRFFDRHRQNPWNDVVAYAPAGRVWRSAAHVPRRTLHRSEFYADLLRPQRIDRCTTVWGEAGNGHTLGFSLMHGGDDDADSHDARLLQALAPHLQRAAWTATRLASLEARDRMARDSLDRLPQGVLWLDAQGGILFANRSAARLLAKRDGIHAGRDGLAAAAPADTARLRRLIAAALRGEGGGRMLASRADGRAALSLVAVPAPPSAAWAEAPPAALILIGDPERDSSAELAQMFGLTPTEARIAVALASGRGIPETARALGIGRNTVRTHLQRIFVKTGTRRQAELARLVADTAWLGASHG